MKADNQGGNAVEEAFIAIYEKSVIAISAWALSPVVNSWHYSNVLDTILPCQRLAATIGHVVMGLAGYLHTHLSQKAY